MCARRPPNWKTAPSVSRPRSGSASLVELTRHPNYYFTHRALPQPRKRLLHVVESKNAVDDRTLTDPIQPGDDFPKGGLRRLRREIAHRNPADAIAAEE